ncbi:MAG TPA: histidine ammonia-lyase [Phycisphaerales bacterium]|nr:histidine ammonia-lyase [Phycisphaerales bacterium]
MADCIHLDGSALSISDVCAVARNSTPVGAPGQTLDQLATKRARLEQIAADGEPHYGVNTGFGSLSRCRVNDNQLADLQLNLIRSHAAGAGDPLPVDVVRATMLLLAASLSRGLSGVRPVVVESIIDLLNAGITPIVPSVGSVGASGDLAPLAHIALTLLGEGDVFLGGRRVSASRALAEKNLRPIALHAKEGLALINGTHLMAARGALLVHDTDRLLRSACVAGAMSIDGCKATDSYLNAHVAEARRHEGVSTAAHILRMLLSGSEILPSHREADPRVQDPYSFRCQPAVLGAVLDGISYVRKELEQELGAVTDNPLLVGEQGREELVSAGNFHGMPIALPLDHLTLAITHIAGMSERRVFHMLSGSDPQSGLTPYLATEPGVTSGLMITQYTAAACCNELIGLCTPATVANISTSAGIEDYNSFGPRAASKAARAVELAEIVVAIELLTAAQAIESHRPLKTGERLEHAHRVIREHVPALKADRSPAPDIETLAELIRSDAFSELFD